ncbi:MAG: AIR synthase related protein [Candidatus Hadarchaeales archaeon]
MNLLTSKYRQVGVDVKKSGIEVFKKHIKSIHEKSFCPVFKNPFDSSTGLVFHTDGAGSKPVQAYLHWTETRDKRWFEGLAQDVVAMNIDDIVCVGAIPISLVDYIALNPRIVPKKEILESLARGFEKTLSLLKKFGISIIFAGGETAELPDQLMTLDVSGAVVGIIELSKIISGENIKAGDIIVGIRSGGRAKYENRENSGIMCNGITLARHCLMKPEYSKKRPEIGSGYFGRFSFDDYLEELNMTVGEAILSPTRIFTPIVFKILKQCGGISGLVHNTGGGLTKCLRLGKNILYVKENLPEPDPIFKLIQKEGRVSWNEMFEVFNMGIGFEVIVKKEEVDNVISIAEKFGVQAMVIGYCDRSKGGNRVIIKSMFGKFEYG